MPASMSCLLGIMLLLLTGAKTDLVDRPENAVTIEWTSVTLHCTTSPDDNCHWIAARSLEAMRNRREVPLTVYDGNELNTSQYFINKSLPGQCDLTILKPRLTGPLVYACSANNGFGVPRHASLAVLKSNLLCASNVKLGATVVNGQTVRYSIHLVYASDMALSVYLERFNGSVVKICSDSKKAGNVWRLECDYATTENRPHTFFAAVSEAANGEGIDIDKTLPTERFYCSNNDWRKVTDKPELSPASTADYINNTDPQNMTAMSAVVADGVTSCGNNLSVSSTCTTVNTVGIVLGVVILLSAMILLCWFSHRPTHSKRRRIQLNSHVNDE